MLGRSQLKNLFPEDTTPDGDDVPNGFGILAPAERGHWSVNPTSHKGKWTDDAIAHLRRVTEATALQARSYGTSRTLR